MKAVCLLSGGMDSTTLAYVAKDMGYDILALHLNYGQLTEEKERACARTVAGLLGAEEFLEIDVGYFSQFGKSALTDPTITVEDYKEGEAGIPKTYVPFRTANLLAMAVSFAESRDAFLEAVEKLGGADGPAEIFAGRCQRFTVRPPPEDWDGVYEMTGK